MKPLDQCFLKWIILFFSFLVFLGAGYGFFLKKTQAKYSQLKAHSLYLEQDIKSKKHIITELHHYFKSKKINKITIERLIKRQDVAKIFQDILQLIFLYNVSVESYLPMTEIKHEFYMERSLSIVVTGSFQQIVQFLDEIETMDALVVCDDFVISTVDASIPGDTLRMSIIIKAYYEKSHNLKHIKIAHDALSSSPFKSEDTSNQQKSLENFPLDSFYFVGVLSRGQTIWALIRKPDGLISFVMPGDFIGKEHGKIVLVTDKYIRITEDTLFSKNSIKKIITLYLRRNTLTGISK